MTTTTRTNVRAGAVSVPHKVGLALATLLALGDLAGPFTVAPAANEVGPPAGVLWLGFALGTVTLLTVLWALRTDAPIARWLVAGSRTLSLLLALPALVLDVPTPITVLVGVAVLATATVVVLVLIPTRTEAVR